MLRTFWLARTIRQRHGPLLSFALPQMLVLAASCAHLAVMLAAPGVYRRRRGAVQFGMRLTRMLVYVWHTRLSRGAVTWWQARLLAPEADPSRSLSVAMAGASMSYFVLAMLNPCPVALQPLLTGIATLTWTNGWAGFGRECWEHPKLAAAGAAMCEWLQMVMIGVNNAGFAAFG
jgi:hypothetical protein